VLSAMMTHSKGFFGAIPRFPLRALQKVGEWGFFVKSRPVDICPLASAYWSFFGKAYKSKKNCAVSEGQISGLRFLRRVSEINRVALNPRYLV